MNAQASVVQRITHQIEHAQKCKLAVLRAQQLELRRQVGSLHTGTTGTICTICTICTFCALHFLRSALCTFCTLRSALSALCALLAELVWGVHGGRRTHCARATLGCVDRRIACRWTPSWRQVPPHPHLASMHDSGNAVSKEIIYSIQQDLASSSVERTVRHGPVQMFCETGLDGTTRETVFVNRCEIVSCGTRRPGRCTRRRSGDSVRRQSPRKIHKSELQHMRARARARARPQRYTPPPVYQVQGPRGVLRVRGGEGGGADAGGLLFDVVLFLFLAQASGVSTRALRCVTRGTAGAQPLRALAESCARARSRPACAKQDPAFFLVPKKDARVFAPVPARRQSGPWPRPVCMCVRALLGV